MDITSKKQSQLWRVDSSVKTTSSLQRILSGLWLLVIIVLALLSHLYWWQLLLFFVVLVGTIWFYLLQQYKVVHITQPLSEVRRSTTTKNDHWFVYVQPRLLFKKSSHHKNKQIYNQRQHNNDENIASLDAVDNNTCLWQCKLTSVYCTHYLVILYFEVSSPIHRNLTVPIWRDQLTRDDWRKLQVMARFF